MKRINQTIMNFKNGNCMQACVASILEKDLDEVPNFMSQGDSRFFKILKKYFSDLNIDLINVHPDYQEDIYDHYAIAIGTSPRNKKQNHSVVWFQGKVVHDPHPDNSGIASKPKSFWIFTVKNPR